MATVEERMNAYVAGEALPQAEPERGSEADLLNRLEAREAPEEVPEEIPEETPETQDEPVAEQPEESEEQAEEAPEEQAEELPEAAEDEVVISNIAQLAEHDGIDIAELYKIGVPYTGPDGERYEISLGEMKDAYQDRSIAKKAAEDAKAQTEALLQKQKALNDAINESEAYTTMVTDAAIKELTQEFNQVNWQQLQAEDPARYAAKRQDYIERNAKLQQLSAHAKQQIAARKAQLEHEVREHRQQMLQREGAALLDAIPEWKNDEIAFTEKQRVSDYLIGNGYPPEAVAETADHRIVAIARKAMLYDEQKQKADVAKKKVVRIGKKPIKSGARQSKQDQTQDATRALRSKLKKSGSINDAVALYQQLGG